MAHAHHHEDQRAYYLEQIGTIVLSAILGGIAVLAYEQGMLQFMLATKFHLPVLIGGITLLVLAAVRTVAFVTAVRRGAAHEHECCGHDHVHADGEACCHDHAHDHHHAHEHVHDHDHAHEHAHDHAHAHAVDHDHHHEHAAATGLLEEPSAKPAAAVAGGHDCGHDHGFSPWRYAILLLPVVLYALNLPNQGFANLSDDTDVSGMGGMHDVAEKGTVHLDFQELERAGYSPVTRAAYEGYTGVLKGQFASTGDPQIFRLVRFKMTCCAADAVPLRVMIVAPKPVTHVTDLQWVEVRGQIQFRAQKHANGQEEFVPVLQIKDNKDIVLTQPESAFLQ